ncbi:GNAT family N-acetyltransferase [Spirilliplanes yamanashiensis]|uniref:N-acetyltransferase n=1 Tax=Spirilliplanes yamanashiensis TaxID=42233 RepID=A0A8J3YC18_9ACTN|nr:GNAT family N-acetyltransferase [Spirilliplanes yamanashiensis]MDP9816444.1 GNAT superfamily N-acetyltransferase [Spirilliplanes yamanashiensis]GIJ05971.1 N-acetyltransferase [Spirilliplanes yamanashiensis]
MTYLPDLIARLERGDRLPADPWLTVLPAPRPDRAAVLAFPGRVVVAAAVTPRWVAAALPSDDLGAPLNPPFLSALEAELGLAVNNVDVLLLAGPLQGDPPEPLRPAPGHDHPRAARARRYRDDVEVLQADGGVLILGRGLAGRHEAAVEVDPAHRGTGLGRRLAASARHLTSDGRPVWAQVAPGNAASLRAFLAAGYTPVGAEALLLPPGLALG